MMTLGEAGILKEWTNLQSADTPLIYGENHDTRPTAQPFVRFHVGFYTQNPSRAEMSVCFCRALGVSEHAVFLPNVNSVGNSWNKLRSHGMGGFKNKISAVRP